MDYSFIEGPGVVRLQPCVQEDVQQLRSTPGKLDRLAQAQAQHTYAPISAPFHADLAHPLAYVELGSLCLTCSSNFHLSTCLVRLFEAAAAQHSRQAGPPCRSPGAAHVRSVGYSPESPAITQSFVVLGTG